MWTKLLHLICPQLPRLKKSLDEMVTLNQQQRHALQKLEDVVSRDKNATTTEVDKIVVPNHAIHRYRQRFDGKGTDDNIRMLLYKLVTRLLYTMDTLPDGDYTLSRGMTGRIIDSTLVTIFKSKSVNAVAGLYSKKLKGH